MDGTSIATAFVGAAAALISAETSLALQGQQLARAILDGASTVDALSGYVAGGRVLDVNQALQRLYQAPSSPAAAARRRLRSLLWEHLPAADGPAVGAPAGG